MLKDELPTDEPVWSSRYQLASLIWIYQGRPSYKVSGFGRFDQYDLMPEAVPTTDSILFFKYDYDDFPPSFPHRTLIKSWDGVLELYRISKSP